MTIEEIDRLIKAGIVRIHSTKLFPALRGFVYYSGKGCHHIFVNEALSRQGKQEIVFHEIHHINEDIPRLKYFVGLDLQWEKFERRADTVARENYKKYKSKKK